MRCNWHFGKRKEALRGTAETRKGENEVFWTLLLKEIGFPALYTRMIDVNLNGNIYRAILQEDAAKEFLERNNLTEIKRSKLKRRCLSTHSSK